MYTARQVEAMGAWTHSKDESTKQQHGDHLAFSRPAITTGAHMPWNSRNRTSFVAPRAFTNPQTVPAITILNQKQEFTKLVFSKDPQPSTMIVPAETPFQQVAHISLSDEEEQNEKPASRPSSVVRPSEMRPPIVQSAPQNFTSRRNQSSSTCASTQAHLSMQSQPQSIQLELNPAGIRDPSKSFIQTSFGKAEQQLITTSKPLGNIESPQRFLNPSNKAGERQNLAGNVQSITIKEIQPTLLSHPDSAIAGSIQLPAPSLAERSSGGSTQLLVEENTPQSQGEANLCLEDLDPSWPVNEMNEDSSRSVGLVPGKRKASSWDGAQNDGSLREYLSSTVALSGRPLKRRLSPKSLASKLNEKKTQHYRRMENLVVRLQDEQAALQSRLSAQTRTCNELRASLQTAEQKLKAQEEVNSKLMLEMQFLKSSLIPVPGADMEAIHPPGRPPLLPTLAPSSSLQELPWMDRLASICMPTLAEVAADFETDCPLVQPTEGPAPQDWQIW